MDPSAGPPMDPPAGDLAELPLSELPLSELLRRLAARTPAPGGGSSAAVACALAAGLVEMAAGFDRAPEAGRTGARAAALRAEALELAERELHSYQPVLDALRLPADDLERGHELAAARSSASDAPFRVAAIGAELAELAGELACAGNPHLAGDAIAGALLAEASCRAAGRLVELNLRQAPEDARVSRTADLVRRAWQARLQALSVGAPTPTTKEAGT